jgi:DNA-binding response OmpR family regulator
MILVVDNDPVFLGRASAVFTSNNEQVLCARGTDRALELIMNIGSEFGVVLVDLDLDDGNGFDLISKIRKLDANLPVIAMSGVFSNATLESSKMFGAQEILHKPISDEWSLVVTRVRRTLNASSKLGVR